MDCVSFFVKRFISLSEQMSTDVKTFLVILFPVALCVNVQIFKNWYPRMLHTNERNNVCSNFCVNRNTKGFGAAIKANWHCCLLPDCLVHVYLARHIAYVRRITFAFPRNMKFPCYYSGYALKYNTFSSLRISYCKLRTDVGDKLADFLQTLLLQAVPVRWNIWLFFYINNNVIANFSVQHRYKVSRINQSTNEDARESTMPTRAYIVKLKT